MSAQQRKSVHHGAVKSSPVTSALSDSPCARFCEVACLLQLPGLDGRIDGCLPLAVTEAHLLDDIVAGHCGVWQEVLQQRDDVGATKQWLTAVRLTRNELSENRYPA